MFVKRKNLNVYFISSRNPINFRWINTSSACPQEHLQVFFVDIQLYVILFKLIFLLTRPYRCTNGPLVIDQTALLCKNWQLLKPGAFMQKKVFEPVNCSLKYIQKDCILSESEKFYKLLKKTRKLPSKKCSDIFN